MKKFIKTAVFMLLICMVVLVGTPFVSHADVGDYTYYEEEPNNDFPEANYIGNDYTMRGTLSAYDSDVFQFINYDVLGQPDDLIVITFAGLTEGLTIHLFDEYKDEIVASATTSLSQDGVYGGQLIYFTGSSTFRPSSTYYDIILVDSNGEESNTYLVHLEYEPHEHEYEAVVTPGSCTEEGYTTYTCICGDSYVDDYVYAKHQESNWGILKEGTCITEGYRYKECTVCHAILEEEAFYGDHVNVSTAWVVYEKPTSSNNGTLAKMCNDCNEPAESISISLGLNYVSGETMFVNDNGELAKDAWTLYNGNWYYFDSNGIAKKNCWMEDSIGWVFLNESGCMVKNAWVPDSVGMCYVGENGYCKTDCWVQDSNGWCYVDANGRKAINRWVQDSAGWCYVGADGYCVTDCWMQDSIGWCYLDSNGRMATNSWILDSVGWCFVGADGYCVTDCWMQDSIGWCYLDSNGRMVTNAWVQDSNGWCYIGEYGYALSNTWKEDSSGWCYLGSNGSMLKDSWLNEGGNWYYLNGSGHMVTGWLNSSGTWYFFGEDGIMWAGCYGEIDGSIYYFYDNGAMLANENYGSSYVESDGIIWDGCFAYLAGADFRSERRDYPSTHALGGYVHAYINNQGEMCVLTIIFYKIGGYNYNITTLHNLTTGRTIEEPYDYYDRMADRYYGTTKLAYLELALEVSEESLYALNYGAYLTSEYLEY